MNSKEEYLRLLGKRVSKERKKQGLTLEKLAYESDISKGNLSDIENGKKDPRYSTLLAISEGLNLSISQLLSKI